MEFETETLASLLTHRQPERPDPVHDGLLQRGDGGPRARPRGCVGPGGGPGEHGEAGVHVMMRVVTEGAASRAQWRRRGVALSCVCSVWPG